MLVIFGKQFKLSKKFNIHLCLVLEETLIYTNYK